MNEYALYKGDDLLFIGTLEDIATELNVRKRTLMFYQSPTYAKRTSEDRGRRLVRIDNVD